eukprot:scaffold2979_cov405-Prasinococcus_capsulatus_cf.AAC.12
MQGASGAERFPSAAAASEGVLSALRGLVVSASVSCAALHRAAGWAMRGCLHARKEGAAGTPQRPCRRDDDYVDGYAAAACTLARRRARTRRLLRHWRGATKGGQRSGWRATCGRPDRRRGRGARRATMRQLGAEGGVVRRAPRLARVSACVSPPYKKLRRARLGGHRWAPLAPWSEAGVQCEARRPRDRQRPAPNR